ncbi:hypothetical protein F4778DRAFT_565068 [Xylariomycetidae sp. FL2044]|nr:hypothetical protein F4778DRAFT_565068 [Xylariomycetidae sp. FL2044]
MEPDGPSTLTLQEPADNSSPTGRRPPRVRTSKACRRCRRLKVKCINRGRDDAPCEPCRLAAQECAFPRRGEVNHDREYRNPRGRPQVSTASRSTSDLDGSNMPVRPIAATPAPGTPASTVSGDRSMQTASRTADEPHVPLAASRQRYGTSVSSTPPCPPPMPRQAGPGWESLPPYEEVVDGVKALTTSYFQLGFLPKSLFFAELRDNRDSVSVFLLCGILSVSARFTPSLVNRYGGGAQATRVFLDHASCLVLDQMFSPTLDSIQGFFLMSIAEWGNGEKNRSLVYMGIAIRLAGLLQMHREEAYTLPHGASKEEVVRSEVARRTFWMLETFENLHSGSDSPETLSYGDITVLLPSDERDFTFGTLPARRAALTGTPPAIRNPELTSLPDRSLFATLLQTHNLWGQVARLVSADAVQLSSNFGARITVTDYRRLSKALVDLENALPAQHSWSIWNLRGFIVEGLDLAYLSATMVLRLSNIILRRSYLHDILGARHQHGGHPDHPPPGEDAWSPIAEVLFDNMLALDEQISAFFDNRSPDRGYQGYPAIIVFCVYVCGSLANHLYQQPQLCPRVAPHAVRVLKSSVRGLGDLQGAWPLARRWYQALFKASEQVVLEVSLSLDDRGGTREVPDASASVNPVGRHQMTEEPLVSNPTSTDLHFSAPFWSDTMFEAFDLYLWGNAALGHDYTETLGSVPWGGSYERT